MKLMSMTDYVLENYNKVYCEGDCIVFTNKCETYANFLKQPLELWMFIPCVGNEPFDYSKHGLKEDFEKAKDRVLFEGIEVKSGKANHLKELYINNNFLFTYNSSSECFLIVGSTIEDLIEYKLTLSQSSIKQLQ